MHVRLCRQTVSVKEGEGDDVLSPYTSDMDPSHRRKRYMVISKLIYYYYCYMLQCTCWYMLHNNIIIVISIVLHIIHYQV